MAKKKNTGARYEDLATAFRHRNFKPLYFLYGEEGFLIDELQSLLLEHALALHERDFNLDVVFGPEADARQVLALCAGYPMMAERRVVVVRGFDKLDDNALFKGYAEQPNPSAVVFLHCYGKPNASAHPYRALRQHAVWGEMQALKERQVPGWVRGRLRDRGYDAQPGAAERLAEQTGTDLRTAAQEVDKLIAYLGERRRASEADVLAVGGHAREENVFVLQKAVGQGDYARALHIGHHLVGGASNRTGEGLMIVAVLSGYFTKLWKASGALSKGMRDAELARHIGVPPYYVKEYVQAARRFSPADLYRAFSALLAADFELKGGSGRDPKLILTLLLRRLAPARARRAA